MGSIQVAVACAGSAADGWMCSVTIRDDGRDVTTHRVRVGAADLARLAPDAATPEALVAASFAFLLDREPPDAILPSFDLPDIGRYFPEYEATIRKPA
jgi:hypothetical protein